MRTEFMQNLRKGYCIIPLSAGLLRLLGMVSFRKTRISIGKKTETHKHQFFSFYIVANMDKLQTPNGDLPLPERAMVIVFPFVTHGWTNQTGITNESFVFDLTPLHGPHRVY
jgi:hypothetical protein